MPRLATGSPLARRYPSFPEEPSPFVNVLCEGPSILRVTKSDLLPGPVIAINHALALSDRLPVDFWATSDDPGHLWAWSQDHQPPGLRIFSTENNILFFEELLGTDGVNERLYGWQPTYMEHLATSEVKAPVLPTVMPVLAWLAHLASTKHVRLFGCDMIGQDSPLSALGFKAEEDIGWEYRWEIERKLISLAQRQYRARGKRLDRWVKVRLSSRNSLSSWSRMQRQAS